VPLHCVGGVVELAGDDRLEHDAPSVVFDIRTVGIRRRLACSALTLRGLAAESQLGTYFRRDGSHLKW
jgi:hypothetical protein